MNREIEQLERQVEAQMGFLRALPDVRPTAAALARVQEAVRAEAVRLNRIGRLWAAARGPMGIAAALVLGIGWSVLGGRVGVASVTAADAEILNDWVNAADASGRAVTMFVDESWPYVDEVDSTGEGLDAEAELDDLLRGFDDLQDIGA